MRVFSSSTDPVPRRRSLRRELEERFARVFLGVLLAGGLGWLITDIVWNPTKRNIQVLAGLIFLGIMIVAQPYWGLIFAIIAVPFPAATSVGTTSSLLIFAMAGLSLVKSRQLSLPSPFYDRRVDTSLAGFLMFNLLSLYMQDLSYAYELRSYYVGLFSAAVLFYLILQLVPSRREFVLLFRLQVFMSVILSVIAVLQSYFPTKTILPAFFSFSRRVADMGDVRAGNVRAFATFPGYELFAEYCAIMIVLQYVAARRAHSLVMRTFWVFGIVVTLLALFKTGTRAGLLILGVGFVYAVVVGGRAIPRSQLIGIGAVALAMFYLTLPFTHSQFEMFFERMSSLGVDDSSVRSRSEVLVEALKRVPESPIIGHGVHKPPGTFKSDVDRNIHNLYLTLAYTIGLPGLFAWLFFVWRIFVRSFRAMRDRAVDPHLREYLLALNVGVVMFAVDQIKIEYVRSALTMHTAFILLGMTLALVRIAENSKTSTSAST